METKKTQLIGILGNEMNPNIFCLSALLDLRK